VIGLLYEDGPCNEFLDNFWNMFPTNKGHAEYTGAALDFNAKLAASLAEGYYHWFGSLTTPPCTEGVSWNLLKARQTVCPRQVDALKAALGATQHGIEFNNRVPQPLNHRVVRLNGELEEKTNAPPAVEETDPTPEPREPLPPCADITDPFQPCTPSENVESGALRHGAVILAALALVHIA
jgi:hypothetical protein